MVDGSDLTDVSQSDPVGMDQVNPAGTEALTHATVVVMGTSCLL